MRVLVVEDDPAIAPMLERGLLAEGFAVDVSGDGEDALWRATETTYAAIVLDLLIPGVNGYEVCRRLRTAGNLTPVMILTAKTGELDEIDLLDLGADDFLSKPVRYGVLIARLRALLRRSAAQATNELTFGRLTLDQRTGVCAVNADPVQITPRERSVLHVLMCGAGLPMAKREILDQVWGMDFEGDPNIVDVYIARLRGKLGSATIETIRGVGFRVSTDA